MGGTAAESRLDNVVIRASAGTGKTYQLATRFLALLAHAEGVDRILATTFTRKAAGEILDRVVVRLASAVVDDAAGRQLILSPAADALPRSRCRELLEILLGNLHRLRICTLDSHYVQAARGLSLELGLPAQWRIADDWEEAALRDEALEDVLRAEDPRELHALTHLLTKGEARRGVAELIRATVEGLHVLYQETTAAAWTGLVHGRRLNETALATALQSLRAAETPRVMSDALHRDCDAAEAEDWDTFVRRGLAAKLIAGEQCFRRTPIPDELAKQYAPILEHARATLIQRVALQTAGSYRLLRHFDTALQRIKQQTASFRFDEITHRLAKLDEDLQAGELAAEASLLAFRLDGEIDHLLLDEFQDTAPAQWRALRSLAERIANDRSGRRTFFCVGDVKQAIYGWRGGVAEIFDWVAGRLPQLSISALDASYRSSPAVIDTVNRVFQGICQHSNLERHEHAIRSWCRRFPHHSTTRLDLPGFVSLATAPLAENEQDQEMSTLGVAADRIEQLQREAPRATVGVLVRRNDTVGKLIFLLRDRGIVASEEGGSPLTDTAAVDLLLSLLRLADHPGDTVARFHLVHSPLNAALKLESHTDDAGAWRVSADIRRQLAVLGYAAVLERYAPLLEDYCGGRERTRLRQLIELAYGYQPRVATRADALVSFVESRRIADPIEANVRVMTVHQAKGLQFDIVVLPELGGELVGQPPPFVVSRSEPIAPVTQVCRYVNSDVQRLLPRELRAVFEAEAERSVAESLCVLYVALTRAVHAVYMVIPPSPARERSLPKRYSGLLRAALTDGRPAAANTELYSCGCRDWYRQLPAVVAGLSAQPSPKTEIRFQTRSVRRRNLERLSPSHLEGGAQLRCSEILARSPAQARARGTLFHAWLEQIEWLGPGVPDRAALRRVAARLQRDTLLVSIAVDAMIDEFEQMLRHPAVAALFDRASYPTADAAGERLDDSRVEVRREYPLAVQIEGGMITGAVDRLVLLWEGEQCVAADVIDFKTDHVHATSEALAAKVEFYRPQIEAYRQALARSTGLAPQRIRARLAFLTLGRVVDVGQPG